LSVSGGSRATSSISCSPRYSRPTSPKTSNGSLDAFRHNCRQRPDRRHRPSALAAGRLESLKRCGRLPADRLQIYGSLVAGLAEEPLLNLEEKAWSLFRAVEFDFAADAGLPAEICQPAVAAHALTPRQGDRFRFAHEMIQRYLVARYLDQAQKLGGLSAPAWRVTGSAVARSPSALRLTPE
jgi:hypothetical protein